MSDTVMVTDHAQFYRVTLENAEQVFYPAEGPTARDVARAADVNNDPPMVGGFAVYDTNISTAYAVDIYPTKAQAQAHEPSQPIPAPAAVFEEPSETATASTAQEFEDGDKNLNWDTAKKQPPKGDFATTRKAKTPKKPPAKKK